MKISNILNTILSLGKSSKKYEENKESTIAAIEENFHTAEQRATEDEKENKASIRIDDNYIASLENQKNTLSDIHQKLLNNILDIMKNNEHTNLTNNDIKIQDGKLYLCGTMFYGELLDEEKRTKEYLKQPGKIVEDGHIKAFDSLIKITKKLFLDKSLTYPYPEAKGSFAIGIFPGRIGEETTFTAKAFCQEFQEKNKDFLKKMTSIISGINLFDSEINSNDTKSMDSCSIPLFVDSDENVFYYDQYNRRGLSGIATNPYKIRSNMYKYEFLS